MMAGENLPASPLLFPHQCLELAFGRGQTCFSRLRSPLRQSHMVGHIALTDGSLVARSSHRVPQRYNELPFGQHQDSPWQRDDDVAIDNLDPDHAFAPLNSAIRPPAASMWQPSTSAASAQNAATHHAPPLWEGRH